MPLLETSIECDVCHERTQWFYCNEALLGRADVLCRFCFEAWYQCGLVDEDRIRRESLHQRYAEMS